MFLRLYASFDSLRYCTRPEDINKSLSIINYIIIYIILEHHFITVISTFHFCFSYLPAIKD